MRNKKTIVFLLLTLMAGVTTLAFQNCSGSMPDQVQQDLGSNDGDDDIPDFPSMTLATITIHPGETINPKIALLNIDKTYVLQWEILSPGTGNFSVTSGTVTIAAGASEVGISLISTAAIGSGDKSFMVQVKEANASLLQITATLNVVDNVIAASITAAYASTCASVNGVAKCWGYNGGGELGTGNGTQYAAPTAVLNLPANKTSKIAHGGDTTCAINDSKLYCWGNNNNGQLGDGTTNGRVLPAQVAGFDANVTDVSVGANHICVIQAGALSCAGRNDTGQLGIGDSTGRRAFTAVNGMTAGVTAVSAGGAHTCAIQAGAAKCWGNNGSGQLGDGTNLNRLAPVAAATLGANVTWIATGSNHSCAVQAGAAKCWGNNVYGQMGDGTTGNGNSNAANKSAPTQVAGLVANVTQISAADIHSCALVNGGVMCWGDNSNGNLGDGTTVRRAAPSAVLTLATGVSNVSAGALGTHSCATKTAGGIFCWGRGQNGQLGNGALNSVVAPVQSAF